MSLEPRILERIAKEFPESDRADVASFLESYAGPEADRVRWDILKLSKGHVKEVRHYLQQAQADYRDILYWAEYYDTDPMLKGRDPKKVGEDLLKKWEKKP